MTTVLDWIGRSLRMLGVLPAGRVPSGQMAADALSVANGLIMGLPEIGMAPTLTEVVITADYTAGEDERVVNISGLDLTITLPETLTTNGQTRTPRNGARVVVTGNSAITFIYLANSGWHQVSGLDLNSTAPLGPELYTGLCAVLAVHLGPEFDQEPSASVIALAQAGLVSIATQFWRSVEVSASPEFLISSDSGYGDHGGGY